MFEVERSEHRVLDTTQVLEVLAFFLDENTSTYEGGFVFSGALIEPDGSQWTFDEIEGFLDEVGETLWERLNFSIAYHGDSGEPQYDEDPEGPPAGTPLIARLYLDTMSDAKGDYTHISISSIDRRAARRLLASVPG